MKAADIRNHELITSTNLEMSFLPPCSCDLKEVCEINTNMVRTCDPSVCTYLDITFKCFPASLLHL